MTGKKSPFADLGRIQRGEIEEPSAVAEAPAERGQTRQPQESRVIMQARVPVSVRRAVRAQMLEESDLLGYEPTQEGIITALLQEWLESDDLQQRVRDRLG
ncbi:hypothetical protein [Deinococcus sp. Marseille-Q6407]|uniref:hypothetical protein n=1 Tax=Deinococcus sp. Marseille-Q6407 TaxID=2969223 RepID=UPI0021C04DF2|nr:hypothetical protein [Deinococcus sp. Marseille-Q6407]